MNNISNCDENRLRIAEQAMASWRAGTELAAEGKNEKALERYLFAFDNGRYVDGWGGVRLSYIPSAIAELGASYPPALDALRERRDARERLIQEGVNEFDIVSEWLVLNRYLGDTDRMLALLDTVSEELRKKIISESFEELLANKQYKIAAEALGEKGRMFFCWEHLYEAEKFFPSSNEKSRLSHEQKLEHNLRTLVESGIELFEVSLAVKKKREALEVARRVLLHSSEPGTYVALIQKAAGVGSKATVNNLVKQAKKRLSAEGFAIVKASMECSDGTNA